MRYSFILILLFLIPGWAAAHISGYTDTSIQITAAGVRVIYTLPSDHLKELNEIAGIPSDRVAPPEDYSSTVRNGWSIISSNEACLLTQSKAVALDNLPSYQFTFTYVCPAGLDSLTIHYGLFFDKWPDHENFVRMLMADQRQRLRFTAEKSDLTVPVNKLLAEWGKPLAKGFFSIDPNRGLKEALAGQEADLPKVVEVSPSLGSLDLAQIDPGFIKLGLAHIFQGLDHVLFVIGLVLVTRSWQNLLALVTAFTLAHTLTLGLSTLGLVDFQASVTEPLIALTIIYIGAENLYFTHLGGGETRFNLAFLRRIGLVFGFGLIHGVGFSYVLREMGMREDLLGSLLYFNLGVELGQLAIIALSLPLVLFWRRLSCGYRISSVMSICIVCIGLAMFVNRL